MTGRLAAVGGVVASCSLVTGPPYALGVVARPGRAGEVVTEVVPVVVPVSVPVSVPVPVLVLLRGESRRGQATSGLTTPPPSASRPRPPPRS